MTNVLLVEDSRISRMAIESGIVASDRYRLVASIENAANAEIACLRGKVDLVLMDVCTAEDESGLTAAEKIKRHHPEVQGHHHDVDARVLVHHEGQGERV